MATKPKPISPARMEAGAYAIWYTFASGVRDWIDPEKAQYRWTMLPEKTKAQFFREAEACIKATDGVK